MSEVKPSFSNEFINVLKTYFLCLDNVTRVICWCRDSALWDGRDHNRSCYAWYALAIQQRFSSNCILCPIYIDGVRRILLWLGRLSINYT